jgi:hypothetical protein
MRGRSVWLIAGGVLCPLGVALLATLKGSWAIVGWAIVVLGVASIICGVLGVPLPGWPDDDERRIRRGLDLLISNGEHFHARMASEDLDQGAWNWYDAWRQEATDFLHQHAPGAASDFHLHSDIEVPEVPAGTPEANQQAWRHMFIYLAKLKKVRVGRR